LGIDPGSVTTVSNAGGQDVTTDLVVLKSQEEFQQSLDISASVNGQYGLFSGNAKFDFASRVGFQSESTFIIARVVVKNAFTQIKGAKLAPNAIKLIEEGKWDRLREQFGDVYVRGFETGGEFYGVLEISSSSKTAQKKIAASLQVKYGTPLAGGKADASMELDEKERSAESRLSINVLQNGGKADVAIADAETMLNRYKEFARLVSAENARPIRALLESYRTLDLPKEPNFIDVQKRIAVLKDRVADLNEILRLRSEVKYVLQNQSYFDAPNVDELNTASTQLASMANDITKGAAECAGDTAKCEFSAIVMPKIVLPKRTKDAPPSPEKQPGDDPFKNTNPAENSGRLGRLRTGIDYVRTERYGRISDLINLNK
jgi:hypothetical protein